jgi:FHS family L-fucose permease-like MFS transporter
MFYRNLDTKDIICWFITSAFLFMFVPAATMEFSFLPYRFIYSRTWFSIQQIVANPLAIKMGSPDTGAPLDISRRNQLFGTTIGAILLGIALFGMGNDKKLSFFRRYKTTFIILGIAFIVGYFMNFSKIENPAK